MELLTGVEYAKSRQKRAFSWFIGMLLSPPRHATGAVVTFEHWRLGLLKEYKRLGLEELKDRIIFKQERIGQNEEPFMMEKWRTLKYPKNEDPISWLTGQLRQKGLDETRQSGLVVRGVMDAVAHRALDGEEHEEVYSTASGLLVARHRQLVLPRKTGWFSTWGKTAHIKGYKGAEHANLRLEQDVIDVVDGSIVYDAAVILSTTRAGVVNELSHGNHPSQHAETIRPETPPDHQP